MADRYIIDGEANDAPFGKRRAGDASAGKGVPNGGSRGVPHIDPVTGEVSGTGSGAGGGNAGEDYDDDAAGSNTER